MLNIHNHKGQLVHQQALDTMEDQAYLVDVSTYTKGIYTISIATKGKISVVERFTKF